MTERGRAVRSQAQSSAARRCTAALTRLVRDAAEYCQLAETLAAQPTLADASQLLCVLATIYTDALGARLHVPTDAPPSDDEPVCLGRRFCPVAEERRMADALAVAFGSRDGYWANIRPDDAEVYECRISWDMAEIYADFKEELGALSSREPAVIRSVGARIIERFRYHWGYHLVQVMGALHRIASDH